MPNTGEQCTFSENSKLNERNKYSNTADKFRAYRLRAEFNEKNLKEAEAVIQLLKNEINFTRETEKNLRSQISSAQNRILDLQKMLSKFLSVSDQQKRNEKIIQKIEQKLEELREKIDETRHEFHNVFSYASKEIDLLKRIKDLESSLSLKDTDYFLMKNKLLTLAQEKKSLETELKLKDLENDLEKSLKKEAETVTNLHETLKFYKQQIEDYEQKIEQYENERKSFLEDFELPTDSKSISKNFTLADSSFTTNAENRTENTKEPRKTTTDLNEADTSTFQCLSHGRRTKLVNPKKENAQNLRRTLIRSQLKFLTQTLPTHRSKDSLQTTNSGENCRKRRLFSTNCNHYID